MSVIKRAKFIFEDKTLYVRFDRKRYGKYCCLNVDGSLPNKKVLDNKAIVEKIVIDKSMLKYKPKTIAKWFENCYRVKTIVGLNNINTEEVKYAYSLFKNCIHLENINFKDLDFPKCENFNSFCDGCENLVKFNGPNIEAPYNVIAPFKGCNKLNTFNGHISLKAHLPLYDDLTMVVYDHIDGWGNKVTKEGRTWDDLLQETLRGFKSGVLIGLENQYKKMIEEGAHERIEEIVKQLREEALRCNLSAYIHNCDGEIRYVMNIEMKPDRIVRKYKNGKNALGEEKKEKKGRKNRWKRKKKY